MNQSLAEQRIRAQFILQQARQTALDLDVAVHDGDPRAASESVRHTERVIKTMNHFLAQIEDVPEVTAELHQARDELHQRLVAAAAV